MDLNMNLTNEWLLVRKPLDRSQCIALLEEQTLKKLRLSKMEIINHILLVLNGFESDLFVWDESEQKFNIPNGFALKHMNSQALRGFLARFAPIGSMYRRMVLFTEKEYFRGQTFQAYQNVLRELLLEIMDKTLQIRNEMFSNQESDQNVRLILLEPFLDSEQKGNLLLSIRILYAIYIDACSNIVGQQHHFLTTNYHKPFNTNRYFANQTLDSIYNRLIIPSRRIRSLSYTLLEYSLRPMFIAIENMLNKFSSIIEIHESHHNEFLFESKFDSDNQLYYTSYSPNQMQKFWSDFLYIDESMFKNLFQSVSSLDLLIEAIKCSFAVRKNSLKLKSNDNRIKIINVFRKTLSKYLAEYTDKQETFEVLHNHQEEIRCFKPNLLNLPEQKVSKFQTFQLPLVTMYNMQDLIQMSLNETFESISRPIVEQFLPQFSVRYLQIFRYYSNFYLIQNPQHIILYMHFLFPDLKDHLLYARHRGSYSNLERLLQSIHQSLQDDPEDLKYNGLGYFKANIYCLKHDHLDDQTDFDWIIRSFDSFYYVPAFMSNNCDQHSNESSSYQFWPISQMFNSKVNDLFNQIFQFLLRLRYFQYLIGNDFLLSSKFRYNDLNKNIYLFRFRLANLIFQLARKVEYRLNELIIQTEQTFHQARTIGEYFHAHHRFLDKMQQINQRVSGSEFINNQFRIIAKFCHSNSLASSVANRLTDSVVMNRKMSIMKNIYLLDQQQDNLPI